MCKKKLCILGGFLSLLMLSCSYELDTPPPFEETVFSNFGVNEARHYFEENASDLSFIHFTEREPSTRSVDGEYPELSPDWSKAVRTENREAALIEVPIRSDLKMVSFVRHFEKGQAYLSKACESQVRLVIARRSDQETQMFVVTLVPSAKHPNTQQNIENFRYLGGGNFTGKVFCSTLEGHFVEASQYVNGHFVGMLDVTTRRQLAERKETFEDESYETILLSSAVKTQSSTYSFSEGSGGSSWDACMFHPWNPASACPLCLNEVIVRYCAFCKSKLEEGQVCFCQCIKCGSYPCKCCKYCHHYPCTCGSTCPECRPDPCTICKKCGRHYCFGSCEGGNVTPPPSDQTECPKCGQALKECKCPKKVDCTQQAIQNSSESSYNWAKFLDAGLKKAFLDRYRNATFEYATSLENINGVYSMREVYSDTLTNNVGLKYGKYTEAAVHNHPSGNPPSLTDIFALASMNKTSNGKFESSFIVPKTGPIYVLHVNNKEKATNFYTLYKDKKQELEGKIQEIQGWLISNGGGKFPEKEFYGYSLARILQEYDSGISLLQIEGESGAFKQMETTVERQNGQITNIEYTICK